MVIPVLTKRCRSVSDVIIDGETGFIMNDTSPKVLASDVARIMESSHIGHIIPNANSLMRIGTGFKVH